MTENGAYELLNRISGTYPVQYKGFTGEERERIFTELERNFKGYTDDDIHDALSAYINSPDSKMPPSPGQLKNLVSVKKKSDGKSQDWDKTRLCYDEEGRLWYNQLYEEVESKVTPGKKLLKPVAGSRPFDGKKGYTPVRIPRSNEELVEISRKRGWDYKVIECEDGRKSYSFSDEIVAYLDNERFLGRNRNV